MKICKRVKKTKINNKVYENKQYFLNIPKKTINTLKWGGSENLVGIEIDKMLLLIPLESFNCDKVAKIRDFINKLD